MGRQLRLGDLKRRQAEEAVSSASGAHRRRAEAAFQKARADAMRLARAEERRKAHNINDPNTLTLTSTLTP
jgi:membrane protein involved in colicin uptake